MFRESFSKSLDAAVSSYGTRKRHGFTQSELNFALETFFSRCITKGFVPEFPSVQEIESGINWKASVGMPTP